MPEQTTAPRSLRAYWFIYKLLPSPSLALYVLQLFFKRTLLILAVLLVVLQSLDLLNRSDDILEATGDSGALFHYVRLRLPELFSQFLPFATLLGGLFSFYSLAQHSEVTVMRGSGLAPGQVVMPMVVGGFILSMLHIALHDAITVPASGALHHWRAADYGPSRPLSSERLDLWLADGDQLVEARSASRAGDQIVLDGVTVYRRGRGGLLIQSTAAEFAILSGGAWTLYNVRRFDLEENRMSRTESLPWQLALTPDQIFAVLDRPDHVRLAVLGDAIEILRHAETEAGLPPNLSGLYSLRTSYHHRIALALSVTLMPILAAFAGFSVARGGGRMARVLVGLAAGFIYFVLDSYMTAMGGLGIMPTILAAYGVLTVFSLASVSILLHLD